VQVRDYEHRPERPGEMARLPPSDEPSTKPKTASGAATGQTRSVENEKLQLRRHYHLAAHNTGSKGKVWNRPKRFTSRKGIKIMRGFISVFAGLLATSGMAWAEFCTVVQTGTLNVHGKPNGRIVGTLNKGTMVSMSSVITVQHHRWAKIVALQGKTGWVLRNYLLCEL
jgi:uncharacterized protein YgiM (DUF1202 family)